jgi:DNA-binding CsgD family transcriptional regulator
VARGRGAEEEPWRPLTAREFEVARLVAEGRTNASIGEQLGLSPRTVGAHVEHILAKLAFTRRAEIAAWVAGMGVAAVAAG